MNVLHFLEKLPFEFLHFVHHIADPYFVILYVVDVICIYQLCKRFNEPLWIAFIPLYHWKIVFMYCWNNEAFHEHFILEVTGLFLPLIGDIFRNEILEWIIMIADIVVAVLATKHAYEVCRLNLKSYGYYEPIYIPLIFILDLSLILTVFGPHKYIENYSLKE